MKKDLLDVGGNIGLSTIGFRELGFNENKILSLSQILIYIKNF